MMALYWQLDRRRSAMGLLSKLRRRHEPEDQEAVSEIEERTCLHVALTPQWDQPEDMGMESRASHWVCGACGENFTPAEAQQLRETEADRIRASMSPN
jgi:hypothetical protein